MNKHATKLLESLSKATWERIYFGDLLNCSQGEETITDINLLDIKRAAASSGYIGMHVSKTSKADEAKFGIDWEWWIGSRDSGWWRYAVQAKKLHKSGSYTKLRHKVGDKYQFDILNEYALKNKCIPLYCLYNFIPEDVAQYWHCCSFECNPPQLGCTVAPLDVIASSFKKHAPKKFSFIHKSKSVIPWRCLACCKNLLPSVFHKSTENLLAKGNFAEPKLYNAIPFSVEQSPQSELFQFPDDYYNTELGLYPKRIMVVNVNLAPELG